MYSPSAKPAKAGAQRPAFRVCYLCGQQFGSASIGIHIPQCYQKKLSQWEKNAPAQRGPKPQHPDKVNWKGGPGATAEQINDAQYETFNAQLVPCPNCGRTFLPDRLAVHRRGCKGSDGGAGGAASARSSRPSASTAPSRGSAKSTSARRSLSSGPPLLPTCYLCGQQFGTASIGIHVPQCYEKKVAQWKNADPRTRGAPPKSPDSVSWRGRPDATPTEQAAEQFQEFMNNLAPCPNCGRKFLPDRLAVHLRSCRPGNTAKAAPTRSATTAATAAAAGEAAEKNGAAPPSSAASPVTPRSDDRLDPKRNRLSRSSPVPLAGRTCCQCAAVEYDAEAKFCRECGATFDATKQPLPCPHCGERVPPDSRFCGTCGQPVDGATAAERTPGNTNASASTLRVVVCPACHAKCDADGNFCDNCGAALGDTDVAPAAQLRYCPTCQTSVADAAATFCEDCGTRLTSAAAAASPPPPSAASTLPPDAVARLSASRSPAASSPTAGTASDAARRSKMRAESPATATTAPPAATVPAAATAAFSGGDVDVEMGEDNGDVEDERVPCSHCGRRFAPAALARHEGVCAKQKTRRVFNAAKQRQSDEAPPAPTRPNKKQQPSAAAASPAPAAPKHDWKAESEAFRRALREARQADQVLKAGGTAKDLPPPTYSTNPDYVACPHCQRRFAAEVARRHIPHCANTVNRPKPPPKRR